MKSGTVLDERVDSATGLSDTDNAEGWKLPPSTAWTEWVDNKLILEESKRSKENEGLEDGENISRKAREIRDLYIL